jgi:hypothetical protein
MTGEHFLVSCSSFSSLVCFDLNAETMAEHRVKSLSALLPTALATAFSEIQPNFEPMKVLYHMVPNHKELDRLTKYLGL